MSDPFICGTPGSGSPKKKFTAAENARDRALLEAKIRGYLAKREKNDDVVKVVYQPVQLPPKPRPFLSAYTGFLFLLESMVIGLAVFGGSDALFLTGCTAVNFFILAPVCAFIFLLLFSPDIK